MYFSSDYWKNGVRLFAHITFSNEFTALSRKRQMPKRLSEMNRNRVKVYLLAKPSPLLSGALEVPLNKFTGRGIG